MSPPYSLYCVWLRWRVTNCLCCCVLFHRACSNSLPLSCTCGILCLGRSILPPDRHRGHGWPPAVGTCSPHSWSHTRFLNLVPVEPQHSRLWSKEVHVSITSYSQSNVLFPHIQYAHSLFLIYLQGLARLKGERKTVSKIILDPESIEESRICVDLSGFSLDIPLVRLMHNMHTIPLSSTSHVMWPFCQRLTCTKKLNTIMEYSPSMATRSVPWHGYLGTLL